MFTQPHERYPASLNASFMGFYKMDNVEKGRVFKQVGYGRFRPTLVVSFVVGM